MCYYDRWFDENWCEEPREEEAALIDAIKNSVRDDIKQEMERLRKENAELQQYKKERQEVENIKKFYESRFQNQVEIYKRELRTAKIKELFGDYIGTAWGVGRNTILPPKCNKCDEKRLIHFKSPRGKELTEPCDCAYGKIVYEPIELSLMKIRDYEGNILRYYYDKESRSEDSEYYDYTSYVYDGKTPFDKLISCWDIVFLDKGTCERYCEWKNEQEAKKDGN